MICRILYALPITFHLQPSGILQKYLLTLPLPSSPSPSVGKNVTHGVRLWLFFKSYNNSFSYLTQSTKWDRCIYNFLPPKFTYTYCEQVRLCKWVIIPLHYFLDFAIICCCFYFITVIYLFTYLFIYLFIYLLFIHLFIYCGRKIIVFLFPFYLNINGLSINNFHHA